MEAMKVTVSMQIQLSDNGTIFHIKHAQIWMSRITRMSRITPNDVNV